MVVFFYYTLVIQPLFQRSDVTALVIQFDMAVRVHQVLTSMLQNTSDQSLGCPMFRVHRDRLCIIQSFLQKPQQIEQS